MKKILLLSLALTTIACKKNHSCRCSSTVTDNNGTNLYASKTVMLDEKYTKKQIKAICKTEEDNINITYKNILTNNATTPAYSTAETRCIVQ